MPSDVDMIAERYRAWADVEARGSSPTYERLARAMADHEQVMGLLSTVEPGKRQPNLLFGALRWLDVPVAEPGLAVEALLDRWPEVLTVITTRRTQTNEVARCAVLLPALASLEAPLAVVEVGASAGLCLMVDQWRYRYRTSDGDLVLGAPDSPLTLDCALTGQVALPTAVPQVAWRQGLDVEPVDPSDPDARRWLRCLVWPEHTERAARLDLALQHAAEHPVQVTAGDLVDDLPAQLERVPPGATPVVMHSATLAYVDADRRAAFLEVIQEFGAHRVGAEGPRVLPHLAAQLPDDVGGRFVVSVDDRVVALAGAHGDELVALP